MSLPKFIKPTKPAKERHPNLNRSLPTGKEWMAHTGKRARLRNLNRSCKSILDSKDPEIQKAIQKVREAVGPGPFSEYGVLMALVAANEIIDTQNNISLLDALDYIVMTVPNTKETRID